MDQKEKSDDKKDIEMEEMEKKLNSENKVKDKIAEIETAPTTEVENGVKIHKTEGREVQPKKIPIGGIQMPGFFTRSKSKEKCKEDEAEQQGEAEAISLIETKNKENQDDSKIQHTRIKLPNPFRKSKAISEEDSDKSTEPKEKKRLIHNIRLPLVSVFPRKKKDEQNLGQASFAGLASMETLDENDKTADKKEEDLKNEKLDLEKQNSEEESMWRQKIKAYRIVISAFLVFVLFIIIIITVTLPSGKSYSVPIRDGRYVETITSCGKIEGILEDGAVAFRGIPYARPPVGELRFKPAQPLNSVSYCWNNSSPLLTHNESDYCMQIYGNGTVSGSEDCLTLDVVTPYVRYDTPLPVVVLIGSESLTGGSPGKMRPSARYARSRDVIFVRPNFRLGVLGFLALSVLSDSVHPPTSGNYGLSDIVEALQWIQYNIEHFGGDPEAVTLFGHQAGATLVTALSTMKGAENLFKRAWAASGGSIYPKKTLKESESANTDYLSTVQCNSAECLERHDAEYLVNSVTDTWRKPQPDLPSLYEDPTRRHEWLVLDGKILKEDPAKVWSREEDLPVKLVIGTTAHAGVSEKLFLKYKEWTTKLVRQHLVDSKLGKRVMEDIVNMYPTTFQGLSAIISDIRIICPIIHAWTNMRNVPFYVVTQTRGELNVADIDSDVDAILGRYEPKTAEQKRYVSAIQQLFYYYVWHGKIQPSQNIANQVLIIEQDVIPQPNYTNCRYWYNESFVPQYAQLD